MSSDRKKQITIYEINDVQMFTPQFRPLQDYSGEMWKKE